MIKSQILNSVDFTKTQKSRYLENETFFLQIKKLITCTSEVTFNEIWPFYVILQKKKLYQKILQKLRQKTSSRPFCVGKKLRTISTGK